MTAEAGEAAGQEPDRFAWLLGLLGEALEHCHGTHSLEDVRQALQEGKLQLWVGERSIAVTERLHYPRKDVVNIFLAGGDLEEMRACLPGIEAYARGVGASAMMMSWREKRKSGWAKLAPGYEACWTGFWKDLI